MASNQLWLADDATRETLLDAVLQHVLIDGQPLDAVDLAAARGRAVTLTLRSPSLAALARGHFNAAAPALSSLLTASSPLTDEQRAAITAALQQPPDVAAAVVIALCSESPGAVVPFLLDSSQQELLLSVFLPALHQLDDSQVDADDESAVLLPLFLSPLLAAVTPDQRAAVDELFLQSASFTFRSLARHAARLSPALLAAALPLVHQLASPLARDASLLRSAHDSCRQLVDALLARPDGVGAACRLHAALVQLLSSTSSPSASASASSSSPPPALSDALRIIETEENQYSTGSISACGLLAVEVAVRLVACRSPPSEQLIRDALATASVYRRDEHLDPEDIVKFVPRYAQQLAIASDDTVLNSNSLLASIRDCRAGHVVLIGLGTTVFLSLERDDGAAWLLFDSHARHNHQGAAILSSGRVADLERELAELFPYTRHQPSAFAAPPVDDFDPANLVRILGLRPVRHVPVADLPPIDLTALPVYQPEELYPQARQEEDDHAMAVRLAQQLEEEDRRAEQARRAQQQFYPYPYQNW